MKGVIVAADHHIEWLLPWWWKTYQESNTLPVAFFDFGMTEERVLWCRERGLVIQDPVLLGEWKEEGSFDPSWAQFYGDQYQKARKAWFKKPLACSLSPFQETLWMDVDCEVLDSLDDVFSYLQEKEIAVTFGSIDIIPEGLERAVAEGTVCNSGVVLFRSGSLIVQHWKERALKESQKHWGDDCLLSDIFVDHKSLVGVLPDIYNWRISRGLPLHAKVIHWCGEWGKTCIAHHGGLKKSIQAIRTSIDRPSDKS